MNVNIEGLAVKIDKAPNECPFCHNKIQPGILGNNAFIGEKIFSDCRIVFYCPVETCKEIFIGYYEVTYKDHGSIVNQHVFYSTSIGNLITKKFHESIVQTSSSFIEIYNQASQAEQYKLEQICGVGYRKALEFLIKDFCKKQHPDKVEAIEKGALANVIETYIDDVKIKQVAKRAVWLANDETHYVRKWEEKDLSDLKTTINLILAFIEKEYDYDTLLISMPEPKK